MTTLNDGLAMEVDDIESTQNSWFYLPMFSLKREFTDDGVADDTGNPYNFDPMMQVSEEHWLSCGTIIDVNNVCPMCGRQGHDAS